MVDDDQQTMTQSNRRFLGSPTCCQAMILGREIRVLGVRSRMSCLCESRTQPGVGGTNGTLLAFARALVVTRTHSGPGRQVLSGREAIHIHANFCQDNFSKTQTNARNGLQTSQQRLVGTQFLGNGRREVSNGLVEIVNQAEVFFEQEVMVRQELPLERLREQIAFAAEASARQLGEHRGVGLTSEQRLEDGLSRNAHQVTDDRGELTMSLFQNLVDALNEASAFLNQAGARAGEFTQVTLPEIGNKAGSQQAVL